jgi:hypothetical protein
MVSDNRQCKRTWAGAWPKFRKTSIQSWIDLDWKVAYIQQMTA